MVDYVDVGISKVSAEDFDVYFALNSMCEDRYLGVANEKMPVNADCVVRAKLVGFSSNFMRVPKTLVPYGDY